MAELFGYIIVALFVVFLAAITLVGILAVLAGSAFILMTLLEIFKGIFTRKG